MPNELDNPRPINRTVLRKNIQSCTIDFELGELHYSVTNEDDGGLIGEPLLKSPPTITGISGACARCGNSSPSWV